MKQLRIGLQLYTLREELGRDFLGTLEKVREIGYQAVEFAGFGGLEAKELANQLKRLQIKALSSHHSLEDLESKLDQIISYNQVIGNQIIVCPWIPKEDFTHRDHYLRLAERLEVIGKKTKENGLTLCYHNHEFEFESFDGDYGLDLILQNTDPEYLQLELDVYWAEFAGVSALQYMDQYANRCLLIHLKDMAKTPTREVIELGQGSIDMVQIIEKAKEIGVQGGFVEQDVCKRSPIESIHLSFHYLNEREQFY